MTLTTIEEDIANWLNERPTWMRITAAQILSGGEIDEAFLEFLVSGLLAKEDFSPPADFSYKDLPNSSGAGARVELSGISDVINVNALAADAGLTFGDSGLTVIYGDNGSGKSGFARIIKNAVGARHIQEVLPNAFGPNASTAQRAMISFCVDGETQTYFWPEGSCLDLKQIHFYDEACGDDYLLHETELSFRPSALKLLDQLVEAVDLIREVLHAEHMRLSVPSFPIPELSISTEAGRFVARLSAETTDAEIISALKLPTDADLKLAILTQEEGRLKASNPAQERSRHIESASALDRLAEHFQRIEEMFGASASIELEKSLREVTELRNAAEDASTINFKDEPLDGVGSVTWRALWEAAERYSLESAYHEHSFPYLDQDARCPLCQQELSVETSERLRRFFAFMQEETIRKARKAEVDLQDKTDAIGKFEVATIEIMEALATVEVHYSELSEILRLALETAKSAKMRFHDKLTSITEEPFVELCFVETKLLGNKAELSRHKADAIDASEFTTQLQLATDAKNELKDQIELANHLDNLRHEAMRLRSIRDVTEIRNAISTSSITNQSTKLMRTHVTEKVIEQFSRESQNLGLKHVKLDDKGGGKGQLRHKPALIGATLATKTVREVLSEGEQTALGLAGLFTEICFDVSQSALVLDDPITSLDHGRREKVARRISEIALERQVIVFTHDLTFLGDLMLAAVRVGVEIHERNIVNHRGSGPGTVSESYPWKAKGSKERIGKLREDLANIRKEQNTFSSEEYDDAVQLWAGKLSETWERIIRNDVVGKIVDRGTTEVKPMMVKLLAQITPEDNSDFQTGYKQISKWAARHDKSEEVNFVAPTFEEMEVELNRIAEWLRRIVSYSA